MEKLYRRIPYLLAIVIVITITMQLYWSYTEYQKNSSKFKSEIQQALDVALDNYFIEVAKQKNITIIVPQILLKKNRTCPKRKRLQI